MSTVSLVFITDPHKCTHRLTSLLGLLPIMFDIPPPLDPPYVTSSLRMSEDTVDVFKVKL